MPDALSKVGCQPGRRGAPSLRFTSTALDDAAGVGVCDGCETNMESGDAADDVDTSEADVEPISTGRAVSVDDKDDRGVNTEVEA